MITKHSAVTGISLHELKGVSTASDDYALTASGGVSVWKYLSPGNVDLTVEPFSNGRLHLRYQVSSGTDGGSGPSVTGWTTRPLNTVVTNNIPGSSLVSNQITLPAGTYIVKGKSIGAYNAGGWSKNMRIRDVTNNITKSVGFNTQVGIVLESIGNTSFIVGKFTLTGTPLIEVQHWIKSPATPASTDWGKAISTGEDEIYADIMIWKIA